MPTSVPPSNPLVEITRRDPLARVIDYALLENARQENTKNRLAAARQARERVPSARGALLERKIGPLGPSPFHRAARGGQLFLVRSAAIFFALL